MITKNINFDEEQFAKIEEYLNKKPPLNRNFSVFVRDACTEKLQKEEN